jgi:hypothetical protein
MIRIVVQTNDAGMAANVGGDVLRGIRTFDIDAPALEAFLKRYEEGMYSNAHVIGAEIIVGQNATA